MNFLLKPKLRRIRTLLLLVGGIVVVGVVVGVVGGMLWLKYTMPLIFGPFQSLQMAAAQFAVRDVAADLGGMPVTIPRHFANYVEYNGDPGWGEKRKGPRPERTQASKLSSFGFDARFPDMAGLSSPDLRKDKESQSIYNTMWIDVTLTTGAFYPGDGFLDRRTSFIGKSGDILKYEQYEQLPDQLHGLTVYAAAGIDHKTNKPYREDTNAHDIFVHRDQAGRVDTYISCSNRPHDAAPCTQNFSLEPDVKAEVDVSYRRGMLPEWQQIQTSVTQLILSFKSANPTSTAKPVSTKP